MAIDGSQPTLVDLSSAQAYACRAEGLDESLPRYFVKKANEASAEDIIQIVFLPTEGCPGFPNGAIPNQNIGGIFSIVPGKLQPFPARSKRSHCS